MCEGSTRFAWSDGWLEFVCCRGAPRTLSGLSLHCSAPPPWLRPCQEAEVTHLQAVSASAAELGARLQDAERGLRAAEAREALADVERAHAARELQVGRAPLCERRACVAT